jgi:hypothetical protein
MGTALGFRFPRLTIAASLCVALVAAGCASAVPGPSSTQPQAETLVPGPSSTQPQAETFVSDRYGFSITLPTGSQAGHATVDWDASCLCGLDDPTWDHVSVANGRTLVVAAMTVDSAMDLARWRARIVELAPTVCHDSAAATEVTIGGEDALEWTASCSDGYNVIKLAALHGGRGYVVLFASATSDGLADNQTAFDSLMSSFKYVGS